LLNYTYQITSTRVEKVKSKGRWRRLFSFEKQKGGRKKNKEKKKKRAKSEVQKMLFLHLVGVSIFYLAKLPDQATECKKGESNVVTRKK
jgi:hypothetical protein